MFIVFFLCILCDSNKNRRGSTLLYLNLKKLQLEMEVAYLIENEDGVAAAVGAYRCAFFWWCVDFKRNFLLSERWNSVLVFYFVHFMKSLR